MSSSPQVPPKHSLNLNLKGPICVMGGTVLPFFALLGSRPHAVPIAPRVQHREHGLLADDPALVDDQLADSLRADLNHVETPAVARHRSPPLVDGLAAAEGRGQLP